jgi:succinate dehydrogenase / fumarate reductase, membrane anchor subunit
MADMRTPLGKVRGLGSAREGTGHFWRQRLTAVANIPLILFFIGFLISINGADYATVRSALANPFVSLVFALVLFSALYHMRLGMSTTSSTWSSSAPAAPACAPRSAWPSRG